jgi:hypothetical protein
MILVVPISHLPPRRVDASVIDEISRTVVPELLELLAVLDVAIDAIVLWDFGHQYTKQIHVIRGQSVAYVKSLHRHNVPESCTVQFFATFQH